MVVIVCNNCKGQVREHNGDMICLGGCGADVVKGRQARQYKGYTTMPKSEYKPQKRSKPGVAIHLHPIQPCTKCGKPNYLKGNICRSCRSKERYEKVGQGQANWAELAPKLYQWREVEKLTWDAIGNLTGYSAKTVRCKVSELRATLLWGRNYEDQKKEIQSNSRISQ